MKSDT